MTNVKQMQFLHYRWVELESLVPISLSYWLPVLNNLGEADRLKFQQ